MKLGSSDKNYKNINLIFFKKKTLLVNRLFINMHELKKYYISKPMQQHQWETVIIRLRDDLNVMEFYKMYFLPVHQSNLFYE